MTATSDTAVTARTSPQLPVPALIVMACTTFTGIMTETMPAGLLPQIARGIRVSEGAAGQFVSAYALGMLLAAIPAGMATRGARRKPLLLAGLVQAYFITDGHRVTFRDFMGTQFEIYGVEVPATDMDAETAARDVPVPARWFLSLPCTLRTDKATADLGYKPVVTQSDGLSAVRDWLADRDFK